MKCAKIKASHLTVKGVSQGDMLETPLFGRFIGENKFLVFAPAAIYLWLVGGCVFGGLALIVWGIFGAGFYWTFVGAMVLAAGIWARCPSNGSASTYARECTLADKVRASSRKPPVAAFKTSR